jgi:hypothetical protein
MIIARSWQFSIDLWVKAQQHAWRMFDFIFDSKLMLIAEGCAEHKTLE